MTDLSPKVRPEQPFAMNALTQLLLQERPDTAIPETADAEISDTESATILGSPVELAAPELDEPETAATASANDHPMVGCLIEERPTVDCPTVDRLTVNQARARTSIAEQELLIAKVASQAGSKQIKSDSTATDRVTTDGITSDAVAVNEATDVDSVAPYRRARNALSALRLFGLMLTLALLSTFLVIVPAGDRGVLLRFGAVQEQVLGEGLHPLLPLVYSVVPISVRLQSQLLHSEAASRDLQDVHFDVALNWHIDPSQVAVVYQRLGEPAAIVAHVIEPSLEDGLKEVVSTVTAEQLITERAAVKANLSQLLGERLASYNLSLDGIDLLQLDFSDRFRQAVEAKQVAEQDAVSRHRKLDQRRHQK